MRCSMPFRAALAPLLAMLILLGSCKKDETPPKAPPADPAKVRQQARELFASGNKQMREQDFSGSEASFRQALALWEQLPDCERDLAGCRLSLGGSLICLRRYDDAIAELKKALTSFARIPGTDLEQAMCRKFIEEAEEGKKNYSPDALLKAHEDVKKAAGLHFDGMEACKARDFPKATAMLKEAIAIYEGVAGMEKNRANCYATLGTAQGRSGATREGVASLRKAVALYSKLPDCDKELKVCRSYLAVLEKGLEDGGSADLKPSQQDSAAVLARVDRATLDAYEFYKKKQYAQALEQFREALSLCKQVPGSQRNQMGAHIMIGRTLTAMGHHAEAVDELELAEKLCRALPDSDERKEGALGFILKSQAEALEGLRSSPKTAPATSPAPGAADASPADSAPPGVSRSPPREEDTQTASKAFARAGRQERSGDIEGAIASYRRAADFYARAGQQDQGEAISRTNLGRLLLRAGRRSEAQDELTQALGAYSRIPGTQSEQQACRALLEQTRDTAPDSGGRNTRILIDPANKELLAIATRAMAAESLASKGEHAAAVAAYRQALDLCGKTAGASRIEGACRVGLSQSLADLGKKAEAIEELNKALAAFVRTGGCEREIAACQDNLGSTYAESAAHEQAIVHFRTAIEYYTTQPDYAAAEADCHKNIGVALWKLRRYDEAIAEQEAALALYEKQPGAAGDAAGCHMNIALCLNALGRRSRAVEKYQTALAIYKKTPGSERQEALCVRNLGSLLDDQGDYDSAILQYLKALDIYKARSGTELEQAACLTNIGSSLIHLRRLDGCINAQEKALEILRRFPDTESRQAGCYLNISSAMGQQGRYEEALANVQKALSLAKVPGSLLDQAACHLNESGIWEGLGRHDKAIEAIEKAIAEVRDLPGAQARLAGYREQRGNILLACGRHEPALLELEKAFEDYALLRGVERQRAGCLLSIGVAQARLGLHEPALKTLRAAARICADLPEMTSQKALCATWTASSLVELGRCEEALRETASIGTDVKGWWIDDVAAQAQEGVGGAEHLRAAMERRLQALRTIEAQRTNVLASEYRMSWFEDKAKFYEDAASLALRLGRENIALPKLDAPGSGISHQEAALHLADRGRGRTLLELLSVRSTRTGDPRAGQLLDQSAQLEAEIAGLLKCRMTLQAEGRAEETDAQTRRIEAAQARQREIEAELRRTAAGEFIEPPLLKPGEFCKSLQADEACLEYVACEKELLIFLVAGDGVRAFRVEIARDVPAALTEQGLPSIPKLLDAYRKAPDKPEALGLEGLVRLQRDWVDHWADRKMSPAEYVAFSHALARVVLPADLRAALADAKARRLVIVPSRSLAFVSFAALVTGPREGKAPPSSLADCRFLVEDYAVSYVQSLSLLEPLRKRSRSRSGTGAAPGLLLALADPIHDDHDPRVARPPQEQQAPAEERERRDADEIIRQTVRNITIAPDAAQTPRWVRLAETRGEAQKAAEHFAPCKVYDQSLASLDPSTPPAAVCVGYAANRALARCGILSKYRHLLFGAHGHSDTINPWLSCLMLTDLAAPPGKRQPAPLTMSDVFAMKLNAQTVVLAACQTALGRLRAGEGVVGFQLAFLFAGADTVVLTQWEIPSVVPGTEGSQTAYPSSEIIEELYRALHEGKLGRDEALRQAQLRVLNRGGTLRDPFYWGAWQVFGEWRKT